MLKRGIFVLVLAVLTSYAAAEVHYVTQGGSGAGDGSSWGNAWSVADFNSDGNRTVLISES